MATLFGGGFTGGGGLVGGGLTGGWGSGPNPGWGRSPPPAPAPAPPAIDPVSTGIDPQELAAVLYDKSIPLWVGGRSLIGGRIIEGPVRAIVGDESVVSFIVGYCIPANYASNTRVVRSLRLNGKEAWNTTAGALLTGLNVSVATSNNAQTVRFLTGTLAQQPDAWSVTRFGAQAIAYVPMVVGIFENIRTAQFNNAIPFTSIELTDTAFGDPDDGLTWEEALETLATYDGRTAAEFETIGVTGRIDALILGSKTSFPEFLSGMRRFKPHWNIRTTDKLYVVEKGPLALDLTVDRGKLAARGADVVVFHRGDPLALPRETLVTFIDVDRDYEPTTVRAAEDIEPVPSTDAYESDSFDVPVVSTAVEMLSETNFAYYSRELAREQAEYTGLAPYIGFEPGDVHKISTAHKDYYQIINEITRKVDHTVDAKTNGFLTCAIAGGAASASLVDFAELGAGVATYTFVGMDIGAAAATRRVFVVVGVYRSQSVARTIDSITIGGSAATIHVSLANGDGAPSANPAITMAIASLLVPSGTTATVVVNCDAAAAGCFVAVHRVTDLIDSAPHDTASDGVVSSNPATTLDIPANGFALAGYGGDGTGAAAWTGLTEDMDELIDPASAWRGSSASQAAMSSQIGRPISVVASATGRETLVALSWR